MILRIFVLTDIYYALASAKLTSKLDVLLRSVCYIQESHSHIRTTIFQSMKTLTAIFAALSLSAVISCRQTGTDNVNVIPHPEHVRLLGGYTAPGKCNVSKTIDKHLKEEEYHIIITDGEIRISASTERGFLYADQTLSQLADTPEGYPNVIIHDKPRFKWRGMHLDCGRHFFTTDEVKRYIDMMAVHKMNTFHWHLTEDQGWRIEIKKHPELTRTGAWRFGNRLRTRTPQDKTRDLDLYGGYYTQDEMRAVVEYAAARGITVVPEIDLPGHMQAALAAYPQLGCTGGPYEVWNYTGVSKEVLCPGNEDTFTFLEDVLTEVMDIFPSEYIHIGGDECPKDRWKECPKCQARIAELGLEDDSAHTAEHYLQSYVMARIEKFLNERGRRIIGWDEMLEGTLAPNAAVMSWRGSDSGREAARLGHDAVMSPFSHMYLDYCQSMDRDSEPENIGGYLPVSKVYSYEPFTEDMTEEEKSHIIGVQANLWTEFISDAAHLEYMLLPRMSAVAEVQWCQPWRKDKDRFMKDIERMISLYEKMGYNYAPHVYDVADEIMICDGQYEIELTTAGTAEIRYTLDGSDPCAESEPYTDKIIISDTPCTLKAAAFTADSRTKTFNNKAFCKSIYGNTPKAAGYEHLDLSSLNDGMRGNMSYNSGRWAAWLGTPMDITIDMRSDGKQSCSSEKYSSVTVGFMRYKRDWIFGPTALKAITSNDNLSYTELASIDIPEAEEDVPEDIANYTLHFPETDAPFLRIIAEDTRTIPQWHAGAGRNGYLFVDEVIVQ